MQATLPAELVVAPASAVAVSIILPAFNEARAVSAVLAQLAPYRQRGYELIVVDDGSRDETASLAAQQGARVIRHATNRGYGAALKSGIRAARGELVVTIDCDGQHDPADIDRLLAAFGENDMVVGARGRDSSSPLARRPGKWLLARVAELLAETRIPDINSGLRVIRRSTALQFLHLLPNGFSFTTTLTLAMFKEGYGVAYVPIKTVPRVGVSTVNPLRDGFKTLLLVIRTIALFDPLKVFVPASFFLLAVGLSYWVLDSLALRRPNIPSGAVVLLVSSVIVFMFGILADQISALRRDR